MSKEVFRVTEDDIKEEIKKGKKELQTHPCPPVNFVKEEETPQPSLNNNPFSVLKGLLGEKQ